jgi:hypothetical protein
METLPPFPRTIRTQNDRNFAQRGLAIVKIVSANMNFG